MPDEDSGHFEATYSLETNDPTRDHYRSWVDTYDREVAEVNGYAQPQRVADMATKLRPYTSCRILDAGCGSGLSGDTPNAAGYGDIDGCDLSPEMLEKSREKGCYKKLFEADLNAVIPDTPDDAYDVVTCIGVFSFGHVYPDACDELLRVLKSGGYLIIVLHEPDWDKGDLSAKLDQLSGNGTIDVLEKQYGAHLPSHDVNGWVIAAVKN